MPDVDEILAGVATSGASLGAIVCGVVGYVGTNLADCLQDMIEVVGHRGPDGRGSWLGENGECGLGHSRLAILDLDQRGRQPMFDPSNRFAIAFNGEIYNYRLLREELIASGFQFRTATDTEVILNLWIRDGHVALDRLDGMYALAIWDARHERMTIARDRAGIKPMYVAELRPGVVFSSEIKALLQVQQIERRVDPASVMAHLTYLWSPGARTMLKGVRKLEAGTWLDIEKGRIVDQGSFKAPLHVRHEFTDAPVLLTERLRQAVTDQLVADVPVGSFLSGGLDSCVIVALAREQLGEFDCFTIAPSSDGLLGEGFVDDLPYAERAARALGVRLHAAPVGVEMCDHVDFMLYHLDEPQADLAPLHVFAISQLAKSMGVSVLLSGAGGDDLFAGYRRHRAIQLERYWDWMPHSMRTLLGQGASRIPVTSPIGRRARKAFSYAGLDGHERLVSYLRWIPQSDALSLLSPDFRRELVAADTDEEFHVELARVPAGNSSLARSLALDERFFLVDHNLNYTDKMSMAAGVEVRVPFLAPGVVNFAHGLADAQLIRGRRTKWVLREAARGVLPDDIIDRPKAGFGVPLRAWMNGPLAPWINEQLRPDVLARRGIFDPGAVQLLTAANASGRIDASYSLLAIAFIERWLQLFVDQVPHAGLISAPPQLDWERVV